MEKIPNAPSSVTRGVDSITRYNDTSHKIEDQKMPMLIPAEALEISQLDRLLALPNIDDYISAELFPSIENVTILKPHIFRHLLKTMPDKLQFAAINQPNAAHALGRAARLFADEAMNRELLQMYLSALLQG